MQVNHKFCVAPMMGATDRHYRHFARALSRHVMLYTEVVNSRSLTAGNYERLLDQNALDHPVALQLGGYDPEDMAQAAAIGEKHGFDEININVGCPSPKAVESHFGACLMAEPERVGKCAEAMAERVHIPITVKCRLGIDRGDSLDSLYRLIDSCSPFCRTFMVHARKGWIEGKTNTKQNRSLPPLNYEAVYSLREKYPELEFIINGNIESLEAAAEHLMRVDGVMVGRAAYHNIFMLAEVDGKFFNDEWFNLSRQQYVESLMPYIEEQIGKGVFLSHLARHLLGVYYGTRAARGWRRYLAENAFGKSAGLHVIADALYYIENFGKFVSTPDK